MPIREILEIINQKLKIPMKIDFLRAWARSGKCPFIVYVKQETADRGKYYFFEERFDAYAQGLDLKSSQ